MSVLVMFERRAILQDDHGRDSLSGVSGHRGRNAYNLVSSEELSADSMSHLVERADVIAVRESSKAWRGMGNTNALGLLE